MRMMVTPSNLEFGPLWLGHEPDTWEAPFALMDAGLLESIDVSTFQELQRPPIQPNSSQGQGYATATPCARPTLVWQSG